MLKFLATSRKYVYSSSGVSRGPLCKFESVAGGVRTSSHSTKRVDGTDIDKLCVCGKNPGEVKGYCQDCFNKLKEKYNKLFNTYQEMAISQNIVISNAEQIFAEK